MASVITLIRTWSRSLKYWERAALDKIVQNEELTENDYKELLDACLQDGGLAPMPPNRPALTFAVESDAEPGPKQQAWHLERLFNLQDVNALPENQELPFGPQLTLVFGANGAGKTGYARPLGGAAFARGEREIIPDATKAGSPGTPRAEIEISQGDSRRVLVWRNGSRCPELAGFYVFDGGSFHSHLSRSNPISFSPAGLALLTRLSNVTDKVRERLQKLIDAADAPHSFSLLFDGASDVARMISDLSAQSDIVELRRLGQLNAEEVSRVDKLELEIAELRDQNVGKLLIKRRRELSDLEALRESIARADHALADLTETQVKRLVRDLLSRRENTATAGIDQFRFPQFTHIGSEAWREFLSAAKVLADAEAVRGTTYPQENDPCLLCRQPLSGSASELIVRLWKFVSSDAEAQLHSAEQACANEVEALESIDLEYFAADSSARRLLETDLPLVVPTVETHLDACVERRGEMVASLREIRMPKLPPAIVADLTDFAALIDLRRAEVRSLEGSGAAERLSQLETLHRRLKHRRTLGEKISDIESFVDRKKWAIRARACMGSTQHITRKYTELFKELVTDRYIEMFRETLRLFKTNMMVTIDARGQKGETIRQIVLSPGACHRQYAVDRILSDGEKKAVAIADFLTETTLDPACAGLIFDDPVTSMDSHWKQVLARYLAEQAKGRQVIVFTHDLPFLYHLREYARELGVGIVSHWVREESGRPGFVYLNNSPACERDYISADIANRCYSQAKKLPPEEQQSKLQEGFGALRSSYEALVIYGVFNNVVARFEERISIDRLEKVHVDPDLIGQIVKRVGRLSRHIDAHLHSDAFVGAKPTCADLLAEIQAFEDIRQKQKNLKATSAGTATQPKTEPAGGPVD